MLYDGGSVANDQFSVTALAAARIKAELQTVLAGIPPGSPYELASVHESMIAHICAMPPSLAQPSAFPLRYN